MFRITALLTRIRNLFRASEADRELDEELQFLMEQEAHENERNGMSPAEARRLARIKLGGIEGIKEACRDARSFPLLRSFCRDVRHAFQIFRRAPLFTTVTVLTLSLGIGGTLVGFLLVQFILLNPLPFPHPEQLVRFQSRFSFPEFVSPFYLENWQAETDCFQALAGWEDKEKNLVGGEEAIHVRTVIATPGLFKVAGAVPAMGRVFTEEDLREGNQTVVLSDELWRKVFASDPKVLGRTVRIDDEPFEVIGIMPEGFGFPTIGTLKIWIPLDLRSVPTNWKLYGSCRIAARLRPDYSLKQAQVQADVWAARIAERNPEMTKKPDVELVSMLDQVVGDSAKRIWILFGSLLLVFLVCCLNVNNLLMARGSRRVRELAVRNSLGASRLRIVRQLFTETFVVASVSTTLGLIAGFGVIDYLQRFYLYSLPRLDEIHLDGASVLFALLVIPLTTLACGLVPALRSSRVDLATDLKEGGRTSGASPHHLLLDRLLVFSQVAVAVVLALGAGLLIKSYWEVLQVNLGYRTENRLVGSAFLSQAKYPDDESQVRFEQDLLQRLSTTPGVASAAVASSLPLEGYAMAFSGVEIEGWKYPEGEQGPIVLLAAVSPGFLNVIETPLLEGRTFTPGDRIGSEPVAIVNRKFADLLKSSGAVLGRRINIQGWRTVVGVVENTRFYGPLQEPMPAIYAPFEQYPSSHIAFLLRTTVPPNSIERQVRRELKDLDRNQPFVELKTLDQLYGYTVLPQRVIVLLVGAFAAMTLFLAVVGTYGVLALSVAHRTNEFGVRMALGATRAQIFRTTVSRGLIPVVLGLFVGLAGGAALSRLLTTGMPLEIQPTDASVYLMVSAVSLTVGFLACAIPALRAANFEPSRALRDE